MIKNILCVWCEKRLAVQDFDPKAGREQKLECSPPCSDNQMRKGVLLSSPYASFGSPPAPPVNQKARID